MGIVWPEQGSAKASGREESHQTDTSLPDVYMETFPGCPELFKLEFLWNGLLCK